MTTLLKEQRPTSDIIYEPHTLCKNMEGIAREYLLVLVDKIYCLTLFSKLSFRFEVRMLKSHQGTRDSD